MTDKEIGARFYLITEAIKKEKNPERLKSMLIDTLINAKDGIKLAEDLDLFYDVIERMKKLK